VVDIGSGSSPVAFNQNITGLICNTQYSYRITASNGAGTYQSSDSFFTTSPCTPIFPTVTSITAGNIGQTTATLSANVNPNGSDTWVNFLYDNNTKSTGVLDIGSGSSPVNVNQTVSGLTCSTQYSYRITASNGAGTYQSSDSFFTTAACNVAQQGFYLLTPCRLLDTRDPVGTYGGPALNSSTARNLLTTGACGIPADATSLSVNVTALGASSAGWLALFPGPAGASWPGVSTINYAAGLVRANNAIVSVAADGTINIYNSGPFGIHVIIDVNGYFK